MSVDHYENFPVASLLCPRPLRAPIRAIYWFARTADDIADEGDDPPHVRLAALADYRADLRRVVADEAPSTRWAGVFEPLRQAIADHGLPANLLGDLLSAFEQDVVKTAYADRAELLDYCRRSANPVGRLLLHLYGVSDPVSLRQSDAICTSLQLINFWQDLGVDTRRGRLYVPASDCARHGLAPASLLAGEDSARARGLIGDMVRWASELMHEGAPLAWRVAGRAGFELRLVVQGGLRILEKLERASHDSLRRRHTLGLRDAPLLLARALAMRPTRVHAATRA